MTSPTLATLRARCRIDPYTGCWHWRGPFTSPGTPGPTYGIVWVVRTPGKSAKRHAHREAWQRVHGPLAPATVLTQRPCCDGGTTCINPEHWQPVAKTKLPKLMARQRRTSGGWVHRAATTVGRRRVAKLSIEGAREIRASAAPARELAERYGVSAVMIRYIRAGKFWRETTPFSI